VKACKFFCVGVFVLCSAVVRGQEAAPPRKSLIHNGNFEVVSDEWPPPGWVVWGQNRDPNNVAIDTTNPHSGKACLRIHRPAGTYAFPVSSPTDPIRTGKGKAYIVTFWARAADPNVPGVFYFEAAEGLDPWKDAKERPGRWPIDASHEWKQFHVQIHEGKDFLAERAPYIALAFRPSRTKGTRQTLWIDDIVVSEVKSGAEPLLDPSKLDVGSVRHRLGPGEEFRFSVHPGRQLGPVTKQASGVSFHRIGGRGRHAYNYEGEYVLEPELAEAIRLMKVPMTRFNGFADPQLSFTLTEGLDKTASLVDRVDIPQEWVVLELEPGGATFTLSPEQWASAVAHSVKKGYKFRLWEIANEPYTRKATAFKSPDDYAEHVLAVSEAIRKVQPEARIGIGIHAGTSSWGNYLLKAAAGGYDFVVGHYYSSANPYEEDFEYVALSANYKKLQEILTVNALIRAYNPGRDAYQLDTEWGLHPAWSDVEETDPTHWWRYSNICGTLHRAVRLIYYAREGVLRGASGWEMFARFRYTPFAYLTRQAPDKRFLLYWLYTYFNRHLGDIALETVGTAPYYQPVSEAYDQEAAGPYTPTLVTMNAGGDTLYFVIANGSWQRSFPCRVDLEGFPAGEAEAMALSQQDKDANPLVDRREDVIAPVPVELSERRMELTIPAHSVVFITVRAK